MAKTGGFTQIIDGVGLEIPNSQHFRLACCDCGLVHDVVVVTQAGTEELGLAMRRNKRSTTMRRKGRGIAGIAYNDRLEQAGAAAASSAD